MKHSLTTTAKLVVDSEGYDRKMHFSAGNFSTAVSVYLRIPNTQKVVLILNAAGTSKGDVLLPAGRRLEAYTDAGTADLSVEKGYGCGQT